MKYEPRNRNKRKGAILIALFVVVLIVASVWKSQEEVEGETPFSVCSWDQTKSLEVINTPFYDYYQIEDYLYYGETLNLFKNQYNPEVSDPLVAKSLTLRNICTGEDTVFVLEKNRDRQILLDALEPGVYELYLNDNLDRKRIRMGSKVVSDFFTVTRNDTNHKISLVSDDAYFAHTKISTNQMLFLIVEEEVSEQYDVFLDPLYYNYDFSYLPSTGFQNDELTAYELQFEYATALKTELEARGLRVMLSKDQADEIVNTYGEEGRLKKAYDSGAKYYFALHFSESPYANINGVEISYSADTSMIFANSIMYDLKKELQLSPAQYYSTTGIYQSSKVQGMDERWVYGNNLYLRESGGMATNAGQYSTSSVEGTASFAKDNRYGMQGLSISLGYLTNAEDYKLITKQQDVLVSGLADAIVRYLRIEE
ncbi:MAG: N-acetylmuramoyl-L-alanine amidase [Erysipelotrichaceae bacterium]